MAAPDERPGEQVRTDEVDRGANIAAQVEPLDVDGTRTVAFGSLLWLAAFACLLPFHGWLRDTGRVWWLWTCATGFALGVLGWAYCRRRRNRRRTRLAQGLPVRD